ncbi:restriction endonuclease subunit S [Streptococcus suis]|uniref:restriction endonuclease subunit S n=1 Tax=Streptococcus suis TaxID=1307 RepID=UPI0004164848|nr:restriction endonuclease subunit S [Streptococcus suis]
MTKKLPHYRFQGYTDAWKLRKLGEVAKYRNGKAHEQSIVAEGDYVVINSKFVSTGGVVEKFSSRQLEPLYKNEIAFVLSDIPNGKALSKTFLVDVDQKYTLNQRIAAITPKESASFLNELLNRNSYFLKFDNGVGQTNLAKDQVLEFNAFFPTLPEQKAIGTFFSTLDQQITLHQRKLDTLKEQKKTYLKLLFPAKGQSKPALRFQGFEDDWEEVRLGDVLVEYNRKSEIENQFELLSSTNSGIEPRSGRVSGESNIGYKIIKKGMVVLSPQNLWLGNINYNAKFEIGIVSPSYKVFNIDGPNELFLATVLRLPQMFFEYAQASVQGASIVRRNLDLDLFSTIAIPLPSLPEQEAIGSFFQTLDQEIAQVEDKLASLKEMKKTLLRKLFV